MLAALNSLSHHWKSKFKRGLRPGKVREAMPDHSAHPFPLTWSDAARNISGCACALFMTQATSECASLTLSWDLAGADGV
jgi:hypothetical protein